MLTILPGTPRHISFSLPHGLFTVLRLRRKTSTKLTWWRPQLPYFRPRQGGKKHFFRLFYDCAAKTTEMVISIYFVRFGGEAAKTNEKDRPSMLPQAKNARCGASNRTAA
jgi:hypothetical protein